MRLRVIRRLIWIQAVCTVSVSVQGFLLHGTNGQLSRCPHAVHRSSNLFTFRDTCIEFVTSHKKYWDDAEHDCKSRGGHLAVIPNSSTQHFLMAALRSIQYQGKRLWIGLTDSQTEHRWKWVTGTRLSGYTNFAPGENDDNILHWSQDCVFLHYGDVGHWHDNACHFWPESFNYICQYGMAPATTVKPTTPKPTTKMPTTTTTPATRPTTQKPTTKIPVTTTTMPTTTGCQNTNCVKQCPNGYSGVYVGSDGCVQCLCH